MSSTYAHYQGPSSLPSDYATLSRLSSNYESRTPESHPENTLQISRRVTRRESFPVSQYNRPLNPTIGVYPHSEASQHLPTETSPLLDHPPVLPVPRIEENRDYNASAENTSTVNMFRGELAVLTKSAIPVFGYAPSFIFHVS
jgi:multidrug resistance protein, MATE family